jgi:3-dehydroquinate dehydratase/shikimate dehydrogenase
MIFLVLSGKTLEENLQEIQRYKPHIDGAELRADFLTNPEAGDWSGFFQTTGNLPLILTLRKPEDGGHFHESQARRRGLFLSLIARGTFRYIDIEETADLPGVEDAARAKGIRIIRSFHDFTGVPGNLEQRIRNLARKPGDIPKAAVMPKSCRDLIRIIDACGALRDTQKILLGMGEFGFATRLLAPRLGSCLTFASPAPGLAPGLIDPETLNTVYRYHSQSPSTRLFGIIGNPIAHSRSPHIHNAAYTKLGIDGVYAPFHIDSVEDFLPLIPRLNIEGFSVTVPFKEKIIPFCAHTEEAVRATGACNTIVVREDGLHGYNTDAQGFLAPLREALSSDLSRLHVTLLGAGGAARSAAYALAKEGAHILILNRTPGKARRLCDELTATLNLPQGRLSAAGPGGTHSPPEKSIPLIVNATTMGMYPWETLDPYDGRKFRGNEIVYDMVYSPRETLFLKRAAAAGCRIIYGMSMLTSQAGRQFFLYTGKNLEA